MLTSGGHNAGIVSRARARRAAATASAARAGRRRLGRARRLGCAQATRHEGSWWPAWHDVAAARRAAAETGEGAHAGEGRRRLRRAGDLRAPVRWRDA
ncbi:MAG: hypothetical protein MZW92_20950 [Comamonadaceae bacterium]|nr:hypothetical protein [Comamonadaceae bacterium]